MAVKKLNTSINLKDYSGLHKTFEYDKPKAELLAEAANEADQLQKRLKYLQDVAAENKDLQKFLWKTAEGEVIAIHKLEDSHLKNIIGHITSNAGTVSPQLLAEARSRGINPDEYVKPVRAVIAHSIEDDDYPDWD